MSNEHERAPQTPEKRPTTTATAGDVQIHVEDAALGTLRVECAGWDGFSINGLAPALTIDDVELAVRSCRTDSSAAARAAKLDYSFEHDMRLRLRFESVEVKCAGGHQTALRMEASLRNVGRDARTLNRVALLETRPGASPISFGRCPDQVRVMIQGNYWGKVVPLVTVPKDVAETKAAEPSGTPSAESRISDLVSVVYDRNTGLTFVTGFETSERWLGRIGMEVTPEGSITSWRTGFDGSDLRIDAGEEVRLEYVLFLAGPDPWRLLETYAEIVQQRHDPKIPATTPVSWCSWYPYRLGVTEERLLENARIAAQRLKPLGLSVIEADLGWEKDQLPSTFDENAQFSHGLKWLSGELNKLGLDLGVWKAPFTISEFDPLVREHPDWLIRDSNGAPAPYWTWFWAPHGNVYILDLTHPGARQWLRERVSSLAERGVKYFKADFIGCVFHDLAKNRYDQKIVAGGGTEAARLGAETIRKALPRALILNCGGPELPGTGQWPLLYTCNDTGNTGFQDWHFHRDNFQSVACHLFKNRRWGILQPSCLCVGLPGTVEEARVRATVAFLAGGQIDISDTLTTLSEERWDILTATLPPLEITAKPVDLFDPVYGEAGYQYVATCKGEGTDTPRKEHPPASVWHVHVERDWDAWELVGVFSYDSGVSAPDKSAPTPELDRFLIPLSRLGLSPSEAVWGYEFWSRQFLGAVPARRENPSAYAHPGDYQDLVVGDEPGTLDLAFFGPGVKLLCLRKMRAHPWILGASFHQSCGAELQEVRWDPGSSTLSGEIHRPAGESGFLVLTDAGRRVVSSEVGGHIVAPRRGANGALLVPVIVDRSPTPWRVCFGA
ncbi:MAG: alpha-galactosidase [Candidatus Hydrogenedentes bacterium]|nr:alpha-galactosidase [Candidatus Hydrogenedentota bacterium]